MEVMLRIERQFRWWRRWRNSRRQSFVRWRRSMGFKFRRGKGGIHSNERVMESLIQLRQRSFWSMALSGRISLKIKQLLACRAERAHARMKYIKETLIKWGLPDWRRFFRPNEVENRTQSGALWRIFRRSAGKKDASRWLYRIYQCFLKENSVKTTKTVIQPLNSLWQ